MTQPFPPDLDALEAQILQAYRNLDLTVAAAIASVGCSYSKFYRTIHKWREPLRSPASARPDRARRSRSGLPRSVLLGMTLGSPDEPAQRRLEKMAAAQIANLEDAITRDRDLDQEGVARILGLHIRNHAALRRAGSDQPVQEMSDSPARTLSELRDDLRGHLLRIRDERRSRRGV